MSRNSLKGKHIFDSFKYSHPSVQTTVLARSKAACGRLNVSQLHTRDLNGRQSGKSTSGQQPLGTMLHLCLHPPADLSPRGWTHSYESQQSTVGVTCVVTIVPGMPLRPSSFSFII